jgi:MoxR-like ATPase
MPWQTSSEGGAKLAANVQFVFRGDGSQRTAIAHPDAPAQPEPYVAAAALVQAVNLAIYLRRPLLLEGEAGCGKTRLARAIAYELGLPFYAWYVRSTSKAQEGLYSYDAIRRLHDAQTYQIEQRDRSIAAQTDLPLRNPLDPRNYLVLGPLGRAFMQTEIPAVVLIDEIDKADIDFPNDLLTVLDDPWAFEIPETGELIRAQHQPIVIITSNKEKGNLPAPFLRRCIYYYIEFPSTPHQLRSIVDAHYKLGDIPPPPDDLTAAAAKRFLSLRDKGDLYKKPGTSEFLDWLQALGHFADDSHVVAHLSDSHRPPPFPELLFKLRADFQRYMTTP